MAIDLGSDPAVQRCLELLTSTALLLALVATWAFFFRGRKLRLPPGPFAFPIIGNLHMMGELPHKALAELSLKYGPLMSLRLGSALTLVVSSPDVAKEFLKTHDLLFASRPPSAATKYLWYNSSDITFSPYGRYWRQMRKLCVVQLLSSRRIASFQFIREEEVSAMIRGIVTSYHEGFSPVNISKAVSALGIDIICRIAFGKKYCDQDLIGGLGINSMIKETFVLAGSFNIGDYIPYLAWMDLQGLNRRLKNIHKIQDDLLEKILEEHFSQNNPKAMPDLVDVLLAASADEKLGFQITRDNIKSLIYDILSAGSDTSSTSIAWAISELLRNPPVMKKLQDELERVVGMGRMVQESDLPRLVYLQAVVKETLRLHPPGPLILPHISMETCHVLGFEIPSGTRLVVNAWAIGRNPRSWGEDAESFKPERFMEEGFLDAKVENFEWIPFGAGRRGCPGQQMAMIVVEFAVAQLFQCFNWRLPEKREEVTRNREMERRQKQRLDEMRENQKKDEETMHLKDQLRGQVRAELEQVASQCKDMASLLRHLGIPVEGGAFPLSQQVNAAYKQALLRFHPDRASKRGLRQQVEAEETFKLISRLKDTLLPVAPMSLKRTSW